jgi:site-specific DNA-methyltransferase (cytosine-N4-specific)
MEPTPEAYVATMVEVFREVKRALRNDGTLWLNLGDSYAGSGIGFKPKDLIGIPWRVAFALQADGWYLRSDIIWGKPNPMPESVTDRPTRSHEYLFLLAKSERYYYDAKAIMEPASPSTHARIAQPNVLSQKTSKQNGHGRRYAGFNERWDAAEDAARGVSPKTLLGEIGVVKNNASFTSATADLVLERNKRDVWTVNSEPTPEAHFATFPQKLIEPCILAGSRVGDICFDPFLGSGTVGVVCERLGRRWVGLELSPEYIEIAKRRTAQIGLFGKACAIFPGEGPLRALDGLTRLSTSGDPSPGPNLNEVEEEGG